MIKKAFFLLVVFFSIQVLSSCIFCNCPETKTFEIGYTGVTVKAYDTSGFSDVEAEDTVYKNAFGIDVIASSIITEVLEVNTPINLFGFKTLMACSCNDDTYIHTDTISTIDIFMIDIETEEKRNITDYFGIEKYYVGEFIRVKKYFEERINDADDAFRFQLMSFEKIPNSVNFVVDVYFKSGVMYTTETGQINFHD